MYSLTTVGGEDNKKGKGVNKNVDIKNLLILCLIKVTIFEKLICPVLVIKDIY